MSRAQRVYSVPKVLCNMALKYRLYERLCHLAGRPCIHSSPYLHFQKCCKNLSTISFCIYLTLKKDAIDLVALATHHTSTLL